MSAAPGGVQRQSLWTEVGVRTARDASHRVCALTALSGLFPPSPPPRPPLPCVSPAPCAAPSVSLVPSHGVTSQGIATGKYHAAVLTNSAEWEAACVKAGRKCGDLVHPLVYCPELHFSEFTSAVADMKNSVAVGLEGLLRPGEGRQSSAPRGSV